MPRGLGFSTWDEFERALLEYRDAEYAGRSPISGENAYLLIFAELADVPLADRGLHVDSLILFLNRWPCHFPTRTPKTRVALRNWMTRESKSLQALAGVALSDAQLPAHREECERLYASLMDLQSPSDGPAIPTMGPAAASKIPHLMVPALFVMWDTKIRNGGWLYGDFLLLMHSLAVRLRDELAPPEARDDMDGYLQRTVGYPMRKPLAKYIDECNWWPRGLVGRRAERPPSALDRERMDPGRPVTYAETRASHARPLVSALWSADLVVAVRTRLAGRSRRRRRHPPQPSPRRTNVIQSP